MVKDALEALHKKSKRVPKKYFVDGGKEWYNNVVQDFLNLRE